jgi:PAS domain S-box-containing protein
VRYDDRARHRDQTQRARSGGATVARCVLAARARHSYARRRRGQAVNGLEWASFLVTRRIEIERMLVVRMGDSFPRASAPEAEALRRFRSFAGARLRRAEAGAPALDGLRVDTFATARLVDAWCSVAEEVAGERGYELRALLAPLRERFRSALLGTESAHEARRAPQIARRAVAGAIDRIADAFLAVDLDDGSIADANPAAASLLRVTRDELLGKPALRHVAPDAQARWSAELEALAESAAPRRFPSRLLDARGDAIGAEVQATRVSTRDRVLAVLVARVS